MRPKRRTGPGFVWGSVLKRGRKVYGVYTGRYWIGGPTPSPSNTIRSILPGNLMEGCTMSIPIVGSKDTPEPSYSICGAKLRNRDAVCRSVAGFRTPHPGEGRCWIHGGLTPPKSHGRYSAVLKREVGALVREFEQDPDPTNILPELHLVRSLLTSFINRYEENRDAVLAWYAAWNGRPVRPEQLALLHRVLAEYEGRLREEGSLDMTDGGEEPTLVAEWREARYLVGQLEIAHQGRPREILDISDAYKMAAEATKIVERIEKLRTAGAVSQQDFTRVMAELGRSLDALVTGPRLRTALLANGADPAALPGEAEMTAVADGIREAISDYWMTIRVQ